MGNNTKKGKRGWQAHTPNDLTRGIVTGALCGGLTQDQAAALAGISADTMRKYYPDEVLNAKNDAIKIISGKLVEKAKAGDNACMFFYLKTQGGWREVNRTEVTGENGVPLVAVIREKE